MSHPGAGETIPGLVWTHQSPKRSAQSDATPRLGFVRCSQHFPCRPGDAHSLLTDTHKGHMPWFHNRLQALHGGAGDCPIVGCENPENPRFPGLDSTSAYADPPNVFVMAAACTGGIVHNRLFADGKLAHGICCGNLIPGTQPVQIHRQGARGGAGGLGVGQRQPRRGRLYNFSLRQFVA